MNFDEFVKSLLEEDDEEFSIGILCICTECGLEICLGPNDTEGWCESCEEIVKVINPFIEEKRQKEKKETADEELFIEDDGGVLCTCTICEAEIWAEPDATKAWCDYCNAEVHVKNPLIEAGLI